MSAEVGLSAYIFEGKKARWLKSARFDASEIDEVLAAVAESRRHPKDVSFKWIESYPCNDREARKSDGHDPSKVRAALEWLSTALTSKEGLPAAKEAFACSSLGLRSYKAYVKQLVEEADEWILFCDYAAKKKALVVLDFV